MTEILPGRLSIQGITGYDTPTLAVVEIPNWQVECQSLPILFIHADALLPCKAPAVHHMPTLAKCCSPHALRRPLSNCDCNGCSHQTIRFPATFTGRRPKATIQRLLRAVRAAVAGARLQHFCALPRLSPRRRRPASVSNCCGRPQMPTADWALRSSVLNKVVARNVCYITEESRPAKMSGQKHMSGCPCPCWSLNKAFRLGSLNFLLS